MTTFDLHMHSIYSCDGEMLPKKLIEIALQNGINTVSLTDHNTSEGVQEMIDRGKASGISVIAGIELDCFFQDTLFHLLGYGIDPKHPILNKISKHVYSMNAASSQETIRLINEIGIPLDKNEALSLAKNNYVTGELVAEIVLNKPDASKNPLLRPYLPGGSRSDNPYVNFYWDFCGQGKPAYVHIQYISMAEAISAIRNAGGISVLAHPGQNLRGKKYLLSSIIDIGIDGIETYSSYHSPEDCVYYREKAEANKLLITGGSDFHGKTKPSIHMGHFGLDDTRNEVPEILTRAIKG